MGQLFEMVMTKNCGLDPDSRDGPMEPQLLLDLCEELQRRVTEVTEHVKSSVGVVTEAIEEDIQETQQAAAPQTVRRQPPATASSWALGRWASSWASESQRGSCSVSACARRRTPGL